MLIANELANRMTLWVWQLSTRTQSSTCLHLVVLRVLVLTISETIPKNPCFLCKSTAPTPHHHFPAFFYTYSTQEAIVLLDTIAILCLSQLAPLTRSRPLLTGTSGVRRGMHFAIVVAAINWRRRWNDRRGKLALVSCSWIALPGVPTWIGTLYKHSLGIWIPITTVPV